MSDDIYYVQSDLQELRRDLEAVASDLSRERQLRADIGYAAESLRDEVDDLKLEVADLRKKISAIPWGL